MADLSQSLKVSFALQNARREWALFEKTGNGAHAWRAWREYRRGGHVEQLPLELLEYFDRCAEKLEQATSSSSVKEALQLSKYDVGSDQNISGRGYGFGHATKTAASRDVVEFVVARFRNEYRAGSQPTLRDSFRAASERYGRSQESIKQLLRNWGYTKQKLIQLSKDT